MLSVIFYIRTPTGFLIFGPGLRSEMREKEWEERVCRLIQFSAGSRVQTAEAEPFSDGKTARSFFKGVWSSTLEKVKHMIGMPFTLKDETIEGMEQKHSRRCCKLIKVKLHVELQRNSLKNLK